MAIYRSGQEGIFAFGIESENYPVTAVPGSIPTLYHAGYYDVPGIDMNENAQVIPTAGTYRGIQLVRGRRDYTFRNTLRIGNAEFLRYGLRTAVDRTQLAGGFQVGGGGSGPGFFDPDGNAISPTVYKGLPLICLAGGAMDLFDPAAGFAWLGRFAMLREVSFAFQEGPVSPLTSTVEAWPLFVQREDYANVLAGGSPGPIQTALAALVGNGNPAPQALTDNEAQLAAAGGEVLLWQHATWYLTDPGSGNLVDYRDILQSVSVRVTNNLERIGLRRDVGDNNPLSRVPNAVIPLEETVTVDVALHDKLPESFITGSANGSLGVIVIEASNVTDPAVSGQKQVRVIIKQNRLARMSLGQAQPNSVLRFSAATASRAVRIDQAIIPDTLPDVEDSLDF